MILNLYRCSDLDPKPLFAHINPLHDSATTAEQSNTHPHNAVYHQFSLDYGLMVKWMTANMQMYISYLHSRLQRGLLVIRKYVGHHGEFWAALRLCLTIFNRRVFLLTYFFTPAASTKMQAKNFPECTMNFEFNSKRNVFQTKSFWILCKGFWPETILMIFLLTRLQVRAFDSRHVTPPIVQPPITASFTLSLTLTHTHTHAYTAHTHILLAAPGARVWRNQPIPVLVWSWMVAIMLLKATGELCCLPFLCTPNNL